MFSLGNTCVSESSCTHTAFLHSTLFHFYVHSVYFFFIWSTAIVYVRVGVDLDYCTPEKGVVSNNTLKLSSLAVPLSSFVYSGVPLWFQSVFSSSFSRAGNHSRARVINNRSVARELARSTKRLTLSKKHSPACSALIRHSVFCVPL